MWGSLCGGEVAGVKQQEGSLRCMQEERPVAGFWAVLALHE